MLEAGLMIIALMVTALILQEKVKIPLPISLIGIVLVLSHFNIHPIDINAERFDQLLLLLLPLMLIGDVMQLETDELKKNWLSVLGTAGIAVGLSILVGVLLQDIMLPNYAIGLPAMIALMAMVVATDPVTVASVFNTTQVPHKLKFLAESESLFNDATAFAIFSIAITLMHEPLGFTEIAWSFTLSAGGALVTGAIVGLVGIYLLKLSDDPITETGILLLIAYSAFLISEHFHFAGIFAIVVSMVLANALITSRDKLYETLPNEEKHTHIHHPIAPTLGKLHAVKEYMSLHHLKATHKNRLEILGFIGFSALFANVILFVSISEIINWHELQTYWKEILSVFIVSTLIRGMVLGQFAWVSNRSAKMQDVSLDWWAILTFAGVKGGLSILMVHMIPASFEYKALFEAIVVGNIILSIFIYAPAMMLIIKLRKQALKRQLSH
ncbi:MAG: cation:proton antiporter [Thiotrichales bacterium]|nr:cation:proton antiporter [Thiotrichales bacterium]